MHLKTYINDKKTMSKLLFIMCWLVYCSIYLGRINYYAALASIVKEGLFTKSQAGLMGTVFFFCYGGGQLVSGLFGDKFSPYKMIMVGLFASALSNYFLPLSNNYITMALIWGINGLAQSMIWPPIIYIISNVLSEDIREKACLHIASTAPVGTLLTYYIAMIFMKSFSWKSVFYFAAAVLVLISCLWCVLSVFASKILGRGTAISKKSYAAQEKPCHFGRLMFSSGAVLIAVAVLFHGMLKDGVYSWVPTMIMESYGVSPSFSAFLTMFLPVINLSGAYIATYLYKKHMQQNEMTVAAFFFGVSIIPLFLLLFIGKIHVQTSMILLSVFTTNMLGFNYLTITLAPVRFVKYNLTSTISGLFNSITYVGCAISNFGFGFLSDKIGWQKTIGVWLIIAALAVITCLLSIKKWSSFISSNKTTDENLTPYPTEDMVLK